MNKTLDPTIVREALASHARCAAKGANRLEEYFAPLIAAAQPVVPETFTGQWFVVQSEPQREGAVAGGLIARGFARYLPMRKVKVQVRHAGRPSFHREVNRPMLAGYQFASFDPDDNEWKRIRSIAGVIDVLCYDPQASSHPIAGYAGAVERRPVPVPLRHLYQVRDKEAEYALGERVLRIEDSPIALGETVQVADGPFASFLGEVVEILFDRERVKVDVEIFGRKTPIELDIEQLTRL